MARAVETIEQQIIDAQAAQPELTALNSVSNTAIYRLWIFITAQIIHLFERLQDTHQAEVQAIIDNNQYGTLDWWGNTVLAYQHGDLLAFINNVYKYPVVDAAKQIIKYCSVDDKGGKVQIKVAKQVANEPAVLSVDELNGVVDYLQDLRPAGTQITVQSLAADLLKVNLNIYYNASGDINVIRPAVELAIKNYLTSIKFDQIFYTNRFIDAIQAVPGIVNEQVEVLDLAVKGAGEPYVQFTNRFKSKSGFFKIDPDFPLATQINYLT